MGPTNRNEGVLKFYTHLNEAGSIGTEVCLVGYNDFINLVVQTIDGCLIKF
jgi:hypothetical protein